MTISPTSIENLDEEAFHISGNAASKPRVMRLDVIQHLARARLLPSLDTLQLLAKLRRVILRHPRQLLLHIRDIISGVGVPRLG
jgi:hypothetical protein